MSQQFLVLQHLDVEHPGMFRNFMREEGIGWDTVELDQGEAIPDLDSYQALIVMGGPMDVWEVAEHPWLENETASIRRWVSDLQRPFLGVCLGHQLLAAALGGRVGKADDAEVGVMPVELTDAGLEHPFFAGAPAQFQCLQWHGAAVLEPPPQARVLARSGLCPVQALAVGRHAFSIQFHVEVTPNTVDDWRAIPAYQQSLRDTLGQGGVDAFRSDAERHMAAFNQLAATLYRNWRHSAFSKA